MTSTRQKNHNTEENSARAEEAYRASCVEKIKLFENMRREVARGMKGIRVVDNNNRYQP